MSTLERHNLLAVTCVTHTAQGASPALLQIMPYMGLSFAIFESVMEVTRSENASRWANPATAGALAGGISKLIVYPMDTMKKRMQVAVSEGAVAGFFSYYRLRIAGHRMLNTCGRRVCAWAEPSVPHKVRFFAALHTTNCQARRDCSVLQGLFLVENAFGLMDGNL